MMHLHGTKPRAALVLTLLVLLLISGYMNVRQSEENTQVSQNLPVVRIVSDAPSASPSAAQCTPQPDTFDALCAQREQMRREELAMLDEIMADPKSSAEIVAQAQTQRLALIERMEKETALETIVRAGCSLSQVLVCMTPSSVSVFVGADALSQEQLTQILDFSMQETGQTAENIKILARK